MLGRTIYFIFPGKLYYVVASKERTVLFLFSKLITHMSKNLLSKTTLENASMSRQF